MVRHSISVYFAYFVRFLSARMSYKADFIAGVVANFFVTLSGIVYIVILLDGSVVPSLGGWKREEVLLIYGYSMIPMSIFNCIAPNLYGFGDKYIIQGQFDRVLLRPLDPLAQVLFESFNLDSIGTFLVGLVLVGWSSTQLGIHFSAADYLWLGISAVAGGTILLGIFVILSSLSFHFEDRFGIAAPVYSLINFSRYPVPIYSKLIQVILTWVIPFAFASFYPVTRFLGRDGFAFYCYITPLMAVVVLSLSRVAWRKGIRKYASTGS